MTATPYPYPFIDAGALGYAGVAASAVSFAVAFWLLGLLFVGVDRGLARRVGPAGPGQQPQPARPEAVTSTRPAR